MKQFFLKILSISLLVIVFFAVNYGINSYLIQHDHFKTKKNTKTLILGDSHLQTALNSKIITNSENLCKGAENYYITYHKLTYLLNHNKNIDQVILGFSHHNFTVYNDYRFKNKPWNLSVLASYIPLLNLKTTKNEFPVNNKIYAQAFYRNYLIPNYSYYRNLISNNKRYPYIGSAHITKNSKVGDEKLLLRQYKLLFNYKEDSLSIISHNSTKYFREIIDLLTTKNIQVVLISAPLHRDMVEMLPEEVILFFNDLKIEYQNKTNIIVLDYTDLDMEDNSFGDYHHLNKSGADKFSKLIKNRIEN